MQSEADNRKVKFLRAEKSQDRAYKKDTIWQRGDNIIVGTDSWTNQHNRIWKSSGSSMDILESERLGVNAFHGGCDVPSFKLID